MQKEVLSLFHILFLKDKTPQQAALNLIECCAGITLADRAALEMVIERLLCSKPVLLSLSVFDALRKFACFEAPKTAGGDDQEAGAAAASALTMRQRYALCLLGMGAKVLPGKIVGKPAHVAHIGTAIFTKDATLDVPKAQFAFQLMKFIPEEHRSSGPVRIALRCWLLFVFS